jgi:hypothetical protein
MAGLSLFCQRGPNPGEGRETCGDRGGGRLGIGSSDPEMDCRPSAEMMSNIGLLLRAAHNSPLSISILSLDLDLDQNLTLDFCIY